MIKWYGVERRDEKIISLNAAMAQLVERVLGKDEVTGSIPVSSSKKIQGKPKIWFTLYFL